MGSLIKDLLRLVRSKMAPAEGGQAFASPPGRLFSEVAESIVGAVTSQGGPTSTLINSKIKQIEHRQCNDGTGEPKTENVAHIVSGDALSGADCRHYNRWLGVGI
jgi:hypothetical protein